MGKCGFKVVCLYPEIEESCTKRLKKYHTYTVIKNIMVDLITKDNIILIIFGLVNCVLYLCTN